MNGKYFVGVLAVILTLTMIAGAVPANPAPFNLTQPDGFTFQARQIGDEYSSRFETLDGYTIIQNSDGYWVYTKANETALIPTQSIVGKANIKNLKFTKHSSPHRIIYEEPVNQSARTNSKILRSQTSSITTTGTTKAVVILIGFTDKQASSTHSQSYYNNLLFSTSSGANSLTNYYKEVSYNQLNIAGAVSPIWYTSSHTMSYYGDDPSSGGKDILKSKLVEEAISLADNDIDFSQYDGDGDGVVDHVIIIHAGDDQASSQVSTDIWSSRCCSNRNLNIPVDGVRINSYTMLAESSPLGTFAHEFGHDIGLPDLYNTETGSGVVQEWDLMDGGEWNNNGNTPAHPSAWSKIQLGWISPTTVTTQTTVNILQLETNRSNSVYKISSSNLPSTEYFLVENRQKTGYDRYLPDDGIVIWHIDEAQAPALYGSILYRGINDGVIKGVAVEDASNGLTTNLIGAAYSSNDLQTIFSPTSSPNSNSNAGISTGISIYNIGSSSSSMSVSFSKSAQSALSVSASPSNISVGVPTYITFSVTPIVSGVSIALNGVTFTLIRTVYTTNSSGAVTILVDTSNVGTITAIASKTGYVSGVTTIRAIDPNDYPSSADHFALGVEYSGLIYPRGDVDWSYVIVNSTGTLTYDLDVRFPTDYDIEIYGPNAYKDTNLIGIGNNNLWFDEKVVIPNAAPGKYYAKVYGYDDDYSATTNYYIKATFTPYQPLTVTVSPATLNVGATTSFTTTVTSNGVTVSGATVTLSGVAAGTYTTNSNGQLTLSPSGTWSQAGNIIITVSKSGYANATTTLQIISLSQPLTVTANPSNITSGTTTSVTFGVTSSGSPVSGATITLSGAGVSASATTNSIGQAVLSIAPANAGTIAVAVTKSGYNSGTTTINVIAVTPTPLPTSTPGAAGDVWTWGRNVEGQLGDGTRTDRLTPVQVSGISNIISVAGGNIHTMALKNDGTVWTWGGNMFGDSNGPSSYGQLGDNTTTDRLTPVQVSGLTNAIAIAGGGFHSIALKSDGMVWVWGNNLNGQLGDSSRTNRLIPVQVSGLSNVIAIAGGAWDTITLKSDGTVWAFGSNWYGQLGYGTQTDQITPIQVSGLSNVIAIAGGSYHTIALKNDGTVWTWGTNTYGQLGDGTQTGKLTPVQVSRISNVIAIASGMNYTIALKSDGTVWTWGHNQVGQLGDGTRTNRFTPVQVSGLSNIISVAGGLYHTIALKNDGTVWTWGDNYEGQVGDGTMIERLTPVQVSGLSNVIAIGGGWRQTIAVRNQSVTPIQTPRQTSSATPTPSPTTPIVTNTGTVTRSLSSSIVSPGASITVTLTPSPVTTFDNPGYQVIETVPVGFTVTSNTAGMSSNAGNVWTFTNIGSASFTYTITAPLTRGTYAFSGTFKDENTNIGTVSGTTSLRVGAGYDANGNGRIDRNEAIQAVVDFFSGEITRQDAIDVVVAFFQG